MMKKIYILALLISLSCAVSAMRKKADYSVYTGEGKEKQGSYICLVKTVHSENETTIFELMKFENGTEIGTEATTMKFESGFGFEEQVLTEYLTRSLRESDKNRLEHLLNNDPNVKEAIKKRGYQEKTLPLKKVTIQKSRLKNTKKHEEPCCEEKNTTKKEQASTPSMRRYSHALGHYLCIE